MNGEVIYVRFKGTQDNGQVNVLDIACYFEWDSDDFVVGLLRKIG